MEAEPEPLSEEEQYPEDIESRFVESSEESMDSVEEELEGAKVLIDKQQEEIEKLEAKVEELQIMNSLQEKCDEEEEEEEDKNVYNLFEVDCDWYEWEKYWRKDICAGCSEAHSLLFEKNLGHLFIKYWCDDREEGVKKVIT